MIIAIVCGAVIGGIIGFIGWIIGTFNSFVKMKHGIEEAYSTMDVYLKKRFDLIPNLVETVKAYAKHESETLTKVMEARNGVFNAKDAEDKMEKENILTNTLKHLYSVAENYPQLKADAHFTELMNTLNSVETDIVSARKYYNGNVKPYNTKREMFPSSIIAKWFKFEKKTLFEVDSAEERKNVQVKF